MKTSLAALALAAGTACAQAPMTGLDWKTLEAPLLTDHVRLTSPDMFTKAGEAYFSPDASWIIFQAVPVPPEGQQPDPQYSMYVAPLKRAHGAVVGIGEPIMVSQPGSANTCGWFHPTQPGRILFGSTVTPPVQEDKPGFRVGTNKYVWQFPESMEIVTQLVPAMLQRDGVAVDYSEDSITSTPIFSRPGYDAEGSWSPDGRFILYANVDPENPNPKPDADIYIYDTQTQTHYPIVKAEGYDGGPFFSPDATKICYRSDRNGDEHLQIYVTELDYQDGVPVAAKREIQITDDGHVNWAPYFSPDAASLIYSTSHVGHVNYEVFGVDATLDGPNGKPISPRRRNERRITFADGFDGLPVFSPDGKSLMWTSQRRADGQPGADSSQIWFASIPDGVTGADFSGPLTEDQAVFLARLAAQADGLDTEDFIADLRGETWLITFPQSFGLDRAFRVAADSAVTPMTGGD